MPNLDGIPIGDCREPSATEQSSIGCPASAPEEGAACNLALGVTCAYSLSTKDGAAFQELFLCSRDRERHWWLLPERCGELCIDGGQYVMQLDATDCTARQADACELEGTVFAYEPSDHTLMASTLRDTIQPCGYAENFQVTLELEHGCPTRFSTNYDYSQAALACIREKLETKRYTCGELLPCVTYGESLL